jgi:hypothetical protein
LQGDYRNLEIFDDKCNLSVKNDWDFFKN